MSKRGISEGERRKKKTQSTKPPTPYRQEKKKYEGSNKKKRSERIRYGGGCLPTPFSRCSPIPICHVVEFTARVERRERKRENIYLYTSHRGAFLFADRSRVLWSIRLGIWPTLKYCAPPPLRNALRCFLHYYATFRDYHVPR